MACRRTPIALALSVLSIGALGAAALAQDHTPDHASPCRISFFQSTTAGDEWDELGEIQLGPRMMQADGSFMMMGTGQTVIHTRTLDSCSVAAGSPFTARMRAVLVSQNGRTAEITIMPIDFTYTLTFQCGPDTMEYDTVVTGPETVTVPFEHGGTASYTQSDGRTHWEGTVTLLFCDQPAREH